MLSFLSPYATILKSLLAVSLIAGVTYGVHRFEETQQAIGYARAVAEYNAKALSAEQAARAKEAELTNQLQEAQNAATLREQQIEQLNAVVSVATQRLRDTLASNVRKLPSATPASANQYTETLGDLLGECTEKYSELAKQADQQQSDIEQLQKAWPTN